MSSLLSQDGRLLNLSSISLDETLSMTMWLAEPAHRGPYDIHTRFPDVFEGNPKVRSCERTTYHSRAVAERVRPVAAKYREAGGVDLYWHPLEQRIIALLKERPIVVVRHHDAWTGSPEAPGRWWTDFAADTSGLQVFQLHGGTLPMNAITCPQLRANLRWIVGARVVVAEPESWPWRVAQARGVPVLPAGGGPLRGNIMNSLCGLLEQ